MTSWLAETWAGLADLVLPAECAGCRAPGAGRLCVACLASLSALRAHPVRPTPAPSGLPPCVAMGGYDGVLRDLGVTDAEVEAYLAKNLDKVKAALGAKK